jgi:adenylylsulfate kinase
LRAALRPAPGYDASSRDQFYETLANLAALAMEQGLLVLVPATANRRAFRERARERCGPERFAELFVDIGDIDGTRGSRGRLPIICGPWTFRQLSR